MHPAFAHPRDSLGTQCPDETVPAASSAVCGLTSCTAVGAALQPDCSDDEREAFILHCGEQLQAAYRRFEEHNLPADRDAAIQWLHLQDQARIGRSQAMQQAMEQGIQRRIDEGVGYFSSDAALALGRAGGGA